MKRCPECHFTFDDYEQVCDFDGSELTPFPESLPKLAAPQPFYVRLFKSHLGVALLAIVALVISSLVVGYFDATTQQSANGVQSNEPASELGLVTSSQAGRRAKSRRTTRPRFSNRLRATTALRSRISTAKASKSRRLPATYAKASPKVTRQRSASARWQARSAHTTSRHAVARQNVSTRNDSKVTAVFKKTGSVLKKAVGFLKRPFDL